MKKADMIDGVQKCMRHLVVAMHRKGLPEGPPAWLAAGAYAALIWATDRERNDPPEGVSQVFEFLDKAEELVRRQAEEN